MEDKIKIKNIGELKKAFKAKQTNQIITFDIVNEIGKTKPVDVKIKYVKELDQKKEIHFYYKIYFSKESVSCFFTRWKIEALDFIIGEARRLGLKDSIKKNKNTINKNNDDLDLELGLENFSNINLKNVADLKKLPNGTYLRRIYTPKKDGLGVITKIKTTQSNAFDLEYDNSGKTSRLDFPKAKDCLIQGNLITYYVSGTKEVDLMYEVIEHNELTLDEMNLKYKNKKVFCGFLPNEIEKVIRASSQTELALVYLKNNTIAYVKTNTYLTVILRKDTPVVSNYISKNINGERCKRGVSYTTGKGTNIAILDGSYQLFYNIEIVYNKEIGFNLLKAANIYGEEGSLYEIKENSYISQGKNYGKDVFALYVGKTNLEKGKSIEELDEITKKNNIEKDIKNKVTKFLKQKSYVNITEAKSIESLKEFGLVEIGKDLVDGYDERNIYFTSDKNKKDIFVNAIVRKYNENENRSKQYLVVSLRLSP